MPLEQQGPDCHTGSSLLHQAGYPTARASLAASRNSKGGSVLFCSVGRRPTLYNQIACLPLVFAHFSLMKSAILLSVPFQAAMVAAVVDVSYDAFYPLFTVRDTYLSFNIDTGSLHNDMDLSDPMLVQLVRPDMFSLLNSIYSFSAVELAALLRILPLPFSMTSSSCASAKGTPLTHSPHYSPLFDYTQAKNLVAAGPTQLRMGKTSVSLPHCLTPPMHKHASLKLLTLSVPSGSFLCILLCIWTNLGICCISHIIMMLVRWRCC